MTQLTDVQARAQALDTTRSFIVQAPAGSGKTELLIQRYLSLLAIVQAEPEQVLAITFTKKATYEMRARVQDALRMAAGDPPANAHQKKTYDLAKKVLARDQLEGWGLSEHPNRCRIITIDGLCHYLVSRTPTKSGAGVRLDISDDERALYEQAIRALLAEWGSDETISEDLSRLLEYTDNRFDLVQTLLIQMLGVREQWLPIVARGRNDSEIRIYLEGCISRFAADVCEDFLAQCDSVIHAYMSCIQYAFANLNLPEFDISKPSALKMLAQLLTTQSGSWRKSFKESDGFLSATAVKGKEEKTLAKLMKQEVKSLVEQLDQQEMLPAIAILKSLPCAGYKEHEWYWLSSLMRVLPRLAAHLNVVFQSVGQVDHTYVMQSAQRSFEGEDNGSDLSLLLDEQVHHILVDEFQDTSWSQFHLLEQMIQYWDQTDSKTLFLVGDPMQSIYRFRGADVSLFLRAKNEGIAHIHLDFLQLMYNFRSDAGLVQYTNKVCESVFPNQSQEEVGAISFVTSLAMNNQTSMVQYDSNDQLGLIVEESIKASPAGSIGILIRSRSSFPNIKLQLKARNIPYHAHEMHRLGEQLWVGDLVNLVAVLIDPMDNLCLSNFLRAPWSGVTVAELSNYLDAAKVLESSLFSYLSKQDTPFYIERAVNVITHWYNHRGRMQPAHWIRGAFEALDGFAGLPKDVTPNDIELVINMLSTALEKGVLFERSKMIEKLSHLFLADTPESHTQVHIMTIHKAKGLEFDTVILPYLESASRQNSRALMSWEERTVKLGTDWLLAPMTPQGTAQSDLATCLQLRGQYAASHELNRLMYVALSRAKTQLVLLWDTAREQSTRDNSLLHRLKHHIRDIQGEAVVKTVTPECLEKRHIKRNTAIKAQTLAIPSMPVDEENQQAQAAGFVLESKQERYKRHIGIAMHRLLQFSVGKAYSYEDSEFIKQVLLEVGMPDNTLDQAFMYCKAAMAHIKGHPKGQWLLSEKENDLFECTVIVQGQTIRLDRTFSENNVRCIVDYKITDHSTATDDHHHQLIRYAKLLSQSTTQKIALGLLMVSDVRCTWEASSVEALESI